MKQPLTVLGFGAVAPYTRADAPGGCFDASAALPLSPTNAAGELPKLDLALLERTLRRGLSEVTRLFMHAAKLALDDAGREPEHMHVIFASAFGEIGTAEALLSEAYEQDGSSPARFRNSVHNTAAGLLSISTKNHLSCTAVAAGWETVPMALLEAAGQLASQADTVLLVFAEERVPNALSAEHHHGPLAAAFVLARDAAPGVVARGSLGNVRRRPRSELTAGSLAESDDDNLDQHPLAAVRSLVRALAPTTNRTTVALSDGENPWCVDVHTRVQS
ncbi:MAG: hypothetical protein RLZZ450_5603 [Pseudomonadota bacterium]|jgi:hypothetical protein